MNSERGNCSFDVKRWLRFVFSGAINTVLTYGLYLLLNLIVGFQLAYFVSFFTGVMLSYWINSTFVFRAKLSLKKFLSFPVVYVAQYVASAVVLQILVTTAGVSETLAPIIVVIITIPLTYLMSRLLLSGR